MKCYLLNCSDKIEEISDYNLVGDHPFPVQARANVDKWFYYKSTRAWYFTSSDDQPPKNRPHFKPQAIKQGKYLVLDTNLAPLFFTTEEEARKNAEQLSKDAPDKRIRVFKLFDVVQTYVRKIEDTTWDSSLPF